MTEVERLREAGIKTLEALGDLDPTTLLTLYSDTVAGLCVPACLPPQAGC